MLGTKGGMLNFGLRCAQLMADRGDTRKMNIIERTALHYRLERIGQEFPVEKTIQEIELTPMRIYMNIDRKSMELQKRIALLESQVSSLKGKKGGEGYVIK
ncbi:hypothetical protein LCGC14_1451850 [marine sediment metagenome]|uniref:Uncharacterized protein n=1 Tax=marine sediment metagenome TaxID=412755 RepID=A0A0F9JHK3_9ZZZZ